MRVNACPFYFVFMPLVMPLAMPLQSIQYSPSVRPEKAVDRELIIHDAEQSAAFRPPHRSRPSHGNGGFAGQGDSPSLWPDRRLGMLLSSGFHMTGLINMQTRFLFAALALTLAANVQAADPVDSGFQVVHVNGSVPGQTMAWRYGLLQKAQAVFEKHTAAQAPGAQLSFRLPRIDPAQEGNKVEIVLENKHVPLAMASPASFTLPGPGAVDDDDAMVMANKEFPKGSYLHPNVQVRSPGLPANVVRMGDLRLACAAQVAMAKAESLKFRLLLGTVGLFADLCGEMEVTSMNAPPGRYDTLMIEDGERKLTLKKSQDKLPQLGEKSWSDETRIRYLSSEQTVQ